MHVGTTKGEGVCSGGRRNKFFPQIRIISSRSISFDGPALGRDDWEVISLRLRLWRVFPFFPAFNPRVWSETLRMKRGIHRLLRGEVLGETVES